MGKDYTEEQLANFREAGKITAKARSFGAKKIKVGKMMVDVCNEIDQFILDQGADLAFPAQISVNEVAAHYGAGYEDPFEFAEDHLAKLDLGAMIEGAVGDSAVSVDLSKDNRYKTLIGASQEALANGIKQVRAGVCVSEIGKAIENTATQHGLVPIRNLSGHGIGINDLHGYPSVPNYDTKTGPKLEAGMTIAIEPFVTNGAGLVVERGESELFMIDGKKPVRSPFTREFLRHAERFKGFPFARRYIDREIGRPKVNFALKELYQKHMLEKFPPLVDKNNGVVAQSEHSVLVTEDGCEVLTK
jgi:methionyl aminopeptidase